MKKFIISWALVCSLFSLNYCSAQDSLAPEQTAPIDDSLAERERELDNQYWIQLGQSYFYKTDMALEGLLSGGILAFVINELIKGRARVKSIGTTDEGNGKDSSFSKGDTAPPSNVGISPNMNLIPLLLKIAVGTGAGLIFVRALVQGLKQMYLAWQYQDSKNISRREAELAKAQAEKDFQKHVVTLLEEWKRANPGRAFEEAAAKTEL